MVPPVRVAGYAGGPFGAGPPGFSGSYGGASFGPGSVPPGYDSTGYPLPNHPASQVACNFSSSSTAAAVKEGRRPRTRCCDCPEPKWWHLGVPLNFRRTRGTLPSSRNWEQRPAGQARSGDSGGVEYGHESLSMWRRGPLQSEPFYSGLKECYKRTANRYGGQFATSRACCSFLRYCRTW